jgi:hypothetical protein
MSEFFDSIENGVKAYWLWIVLAVLVYLLWRFGVLDDVARALVPLVIVIILGRIAWIFWIHYIQQDFISGIDFVLLEIVPPRDVLRSPGAMELFITNALYHWSEKGGKEEYWQGAVWFWFSLEIASIDGQVRFYIRTPTRIRGLIETQMYAQYPQAQVRVAEDYTLAIPEISEKSGWNAWGCEWKLQKKELYPIRTYIDYELDENPKEEYKIDPISPVIELFGAIKKGEQMWMQIVVRPSKVLYRIPGTFKYRDWSQQAREDLYEILAPFTSERAKVSDPSKISREIRTPRFLDDTLKKIGRKTGKLGFDTGIRVLYVAKQEIFPLGTRTNASRDVRLIFRQYANPDNNALERINSTQGDAYSGLLPASTKTVTILADRMLHEYRERAFFHLPLRHHIFSKHHWNWPLPNIFVLAGIIRAYFHHETYVLNAEELATLWHFPGQILKVPTLERIESKEASPPTNLPT